jgi:hypothetical protein
MPDKIAKPNHPHPAKFTKGVLEAAATILHLDHVDPPARILDPFAGTGLGVDFFAERGYRAQGIELEPEWAAMCESTITGDCLTVMRTLPSMSFDAIVTSPAYGNRMADNYAGDAKGSRRHTYRVALGRPLSEESAAGFQWGVAYRSFHEEFLWCVKDLFTSMLVVNMKDHIRKGEVVDVVGWWQRKMYETFPVGFVHTRVTLPSRGIRHGANANLRVDDEVLLCVKRQS